MPSKKDQRSIWSEQVCMAVILNHTPHPSSTPWSKRIIEADISHDQECFWIGNSRCSCYARKICQKRISFRSLGMGTPRCETSYCAPKRKDSGVLGGWTSLVGRESTGSWQAGFSCNNRRHKPQPVVLDYLMSKFRILVHHTRFLRHGYISSISLCWTTHPMYFFLHIMEDHMTFG